MNERNALSRMLRPAVAVLLLTTAGCSPKIYTSARMNLPARVEGSPVLVYEVTDSIPGPAQTVGTVSIKDSGFSTGCSYSQVIGRAKDAVNSLGGNSLQLTKHKRPNALGSSCHRIEGDILLLPDSVYTAAYFDNLAIQRGRTMLYDGREETSQTPGAAAGTDRESTGNAKKKVNTTLLINAGYAFITSKYIVPDGYSGNPKNGLDVNAALQWTWKSGLGVGVRYSGYYTSATDNSLTIRPDGTPRRKSTKLNIRLHYFAPEFVLRQQVGRKWIFHESVGIGYARYTEGIGNLTNGIGGLGYHVELGMEYKLSKSVGIGISVGGYGARFSGLDRFVEAYEKNSHAGISRISLNGGMRFHF